MWGHIHQYPGPMASSVFCVWSSRSRNYGVTETKPRTPSSNHVQPIELYWSTLGKEYKIQMEGDFFIYQVITRYPSHLDRAVLVKTPGRWPEQEQVTWNLNLHSCSLWKTPGRVCDSWCKQQMKDVWAT